MTPEEMIAEARGGRFAPGEGELPLKELIAAVDGCAAISVEVPLTGAAPPEVHLKNLYDKAEGLFGPDC